MNRRYIYAFILAIPLIGVGCINISTNKVTDSGMFRSIDSGETWEHKVFVRQEKKKTITIGAVNPLSVVFHPTDPNVIYLGTENSGLIVSQDGAESWITTSIASGNASALSIDPEVPSTAYLARGSSIIKTVDDLATWETIYLEPRGISITDLHIDSFIVSRIFATTSSGDVLQSEDFGETWDTVHALGVHILKIYADPSDSRILYLRTAGQGLFRSTNNGMTFDKIYDPFLEFPGALTMNDLYIMPTQTNVLYAATGYGILKSTDRGDSWSPIETLFPLGSLSISTVLVDPNDQYIIYFPVGNVIHKTEDNGATWKTIETLPSTRGVHKMVFHPDDSSVLYVSVYAPPK